MKLSRRVSDLKPSATVAVMNRAKALRAQGIDILNFSAGEPDFPSPAKATHAAIAALNTNQTKYIETGGDLPSRQTLAQIITERNQIPGVSADHVIITPGVKMALYLVMQCLFDSDAPHDQQDFLLPVPAWVSFAPIARLAGARIVEMPTSTSSDFKITPEQLARSITAKSRVLLLNTPSNPCSTMYTRSELAALAKVIAESTKSIAPDLIVVADELYQHIVFGEHPHVSIGSFPEIADRVITVNGPGKSFAMTGWRLGWASGSGDRGKQIIAGMTKLQGQTATCVTPFALAGMKVALTECKDDLEVMRIAFAKRAELIYSRLRTMPGIQVARPIGAFYVYPDVSAHFGKTTPRGALLKSAADFATALLEECEMAVVPGEDFGTGGEKHLRMSFAWNEQTITRGMDRLEAFLASLK